MKTMTLVGSDLRGRAGSPVVLSAAIALLSMLFPGGGSATAEAAPGAKMACRRSI